MHGDAPGDAALFLGAQSRVFRRAALPVTHRPNGGESWATIHGRLPTGETVAIHSSMQLAGAVPNPPHRIAHTEIICLQEGSLLFEHDGRTERADAGDVLLVALGTMHGVRNVGAGPAVYTVFAFGGDTTA